MKLIDAQYEWTPTYLPKESSYRGKPGTCVVYSRSEHIQHVKAGIVDPRINKGALWQSRGGSGLSKDQRLALMMVDFHTMVVRDGLDPKVVHQEFLKIDEYRRFISPDCEGAEVNDGEETEFA